MLTYGSHLSFLTLLLMVPCLAGANEAITSGKILLAGEILVNQNTSNAEVPKKVAKPLSKNQKSGALEQKQSANDDSAEDGVLSPRGGAPAEQREYDARVKEKSRQQAVENTVYPVAPPMYLPMPLATPATAVAPALAAPSTQDRAGARGDKARAYITQGGEPATAVNSRKNSASSAGR
jgi:hypothetical protein